MRAGVLALGFSLGCASAAGGSPDPLDAAPPAPPDAPPAADAAPPPAPDGGLSIHDRCFPGLGNPNLPGPNYDPFRPIVASHCDGTNHQDIRGVEKVVFLGDSITVGTPPTLPTDWYRSRLVAALSAEFGAALEVQSCAAWGARTDDLLRPPHQQIPSCFATLPEPKRTLVVMTVGGNDMYAFARDHQNGVPQDQILGEVDAAIRDMSDAIHWFKDDPARFPNGVFVIFSNIYEYTDGTGDTASCPAALLTGVTAPWPEGRAPFVHIEEEFMRIAVETRTDMLLLLENFCGHGFHSDDPSNECYRGPGTPRYFDLTCIHPSPEGHARLADMFMNVVRE